MKTFPTHVAVVGGGRMGIGIAHVFAVHGSSVTIVEPHDAEGAAARLHTSLARAEERNKLTVPAADVESRVEIIAALDTMEAPRREAIELAVEAVPEVFELKCDVLAGLERTLPRAVLATNTSSLPVTEMGAVLNDPAALIGTHFFNPVPASALVEVVRQPPNSDELVATVADWARELGKEPVIVWDSPGFATSRLGVLLGLEAMRMLDEGVADAESIDKAMELGYRHPMGPLRSTDLVGLDIRLSVARYLETKLGDRFTPPRCLIERVERGDLGRKTGRGFYDWSS